MVDSFQEDDLRLSEYMDLVYCSSDSLLPKQQQQQVLQQPKLIQQQSLMIKRQKSHSQQQIQQVQNMNEVNSCNEKSHSNYNDDNNAAPSTQIKQIQRRVVELNHVGPPPLADTHLTTPTHNYRRSLHLPKPKQEEKKRFSELRFDMLQAGALRVEGEEGRQGGVLRVEGEERPQGGQSIKKHLSTSLTEISSSPNPGEGEGRSETEVAGREGKQEGENTCREGELTEGQGRVGKPVFRSQSARYGIEPNPEERRLSNFLGRYIKREESLKLKVLKEPKRKTSKDVWQVDSSSWEFLGQDLESRSSQPRETPVRNIEELRTTLLQNLDEKKRISVPDSDEKISVPGQNFEVDKNTSLKKLEAQRNANIHRESIPPAEIQKTDKNVKKLRKESILKHHFLMDKFQNSRKEVREVRETGEVKEVMEVSEVMKVMEVRSSDESDSSSESWKKINSLSSEREYTLQIEEKANLNKQNSSNNRLHQDDSLYDTEYDSSLTSSKHTSGTSSRYKIHGKHTVHAVHSTYGTSKEDVVPMPTKTKQAEKPDNHIIIQEYILLSSGSPCSLLGQCIRVFISCTLSTKLRDPVRVMSNVRQFMNGCKNYLLRTGEGEIKQLVDLQRVRLKANEYLNMDTILEDTMHLLIIKPLRSHLRDLIQTKYTRTRYFDDLEESGEKFKKKSMELLTEKRRKLQGTSESSRAEVDRILVSLCSGYSPPEKLNLILNLVHQILLQAGRVSVLYSRLAVYVYCTLGWPCICIVL
ncbi:uncharacterized protein LOC111696612 isoform X2 [Eurytemora carolleeae]|uniref:uncharacterized protein LOC111696612 isoform X2 n=1 Tax=Eurytemora carolleeae TaxID=1294199 RepID=UPI000C75F111|nr:uncharacterized protein LOC111696612 isoform X2 [Eurytemora carolleeae]|eukprot:XP_023322029.1 uncharacterized protein LOC111696612 isoform X2 [Eurytemora affinis]